MKSSNIITENKKWILIGISIAFFLEFVQSIDLALSPMKKTIYFSSIKIDLLISLITLAILAALAWFIHETK